MPLKLGNTLLDVFSFVHLILLTILISILTFLPKEVSISFLLDTVLVFNSREGIVVHVIQAMPNMSSFGNFNLGQKINSAT